MKPETFYKQKGYPEIKDRFDKNVQMFTYWDMIEFADEYHKNEKLGKRSNRQNSALHLYFKMIAEQFTNFGWQYNYVNPFTGEIIEIPWNSDLIKEYIWRPVQKTVTGKDSTTKINTQEINQVINVLDQHFSSKGVDVEFPSIEQLMFEIDGKELKKD